MIPQIKYWFFGRDEYKGITIKRISDMEIQVGSVDFSFFIKKYRNLIKNNKVQTITLQGHPCMWGKFDFANFKLIVCFLKKQGCNFIFPEDLA